VTRRSDMAPQERAPNKNKSSFPCAYPSVPPQPTPYSFVLIAQTQSSVAAHPSAPSPAYARRPATPFPFPVAGQTTCPHSLRRSPAWQPSAWLLIRPPPSPARSLGCCVVPFPNRQPRYVPSLCVARSLAVGRAADHAMAAGAHVSWRLKSSQPQAKPRAPTSVGDAGGARAPRLTASSYSDGQNRRARPSLPYVPYVCFKCSDILDLCYNFFILILQK
jgi:hypothetical protein